MSEERTVGRKPQVPQDVVERIIREREAGATLWVIAERLNVDGVPTAQGGKRWWPATVSRILAATADK